MRVVFMGTPEFAVPSLEIVAEEHELVGVVTQPDTKQGRGQKVKMPAIKEAALKYEVPIFQPEKVGSREMLETLTSLDPEVIVVVAFGQKIPRKILELPKHGCINVHSSLLPKYRGAAPIQAAILNGDKVTGVSTMYLSEDWDAGDVIYQEETELSPKETAGSLHDRLAVMGAKLLSKTLADIAAGRAPRIPQDHSQATYAFKIKKEDGLMDWEKSAGYLERLVRGMNPWPTAYTFYEETMVKVWTADVAEGLSGLPGEILAISDEGITVGTGEGTLLLREVQREGARRMPARDLANGLRLKVGDRFGERVSRE